MGRAHEEHIGRTGRLENLATEILNRCAALENRVKTLEDRVNVPAANPATPAMTDHQREVAKMIPGQTQPAAPSTEGGLK